uniref:Uncharacterized protein n=1 Tax=Candidatus Kentrum sp. DK TaxID=2126562 RepID=A0A450STE2_9GAMM|nr:MAG: hypothetical protein BECKDK2373B_GA0170837_106513 [Candidatus Kentron sp. DK]
MACGSWGLAPLDPSHPHSHFSRVCHVHFHSKIIGLSFRAKREIFTYKIPRSTGMTVSFYSVQRIFGSGYAGLGYDVFFGHGVFIHADGLERGEIQGNPMPVSKPVPFSTLPEHECPYGAKEPPWSAALPAAAFLMHHSRIRKLCFSETFKYTPGRRYGGRAIFQAPEPARSDPRSGQASTIR